MIERWHNKERKNNKEIVQLLNKKERTIGREIKRDLTTNLTTDLIEITAGTIRNYIHEGNVFNLKDEDMIYNKKHKSKNKDKRTFETYTTRKEY